MPEVHLPPLLNYKRKKKEKNMPGFTNTASYERRRGLCARKETTGTKGNDVTKGRKRAYKSRDRGKREIIGNRAATRSGPFQT